MSWDIVLFNSKENISSIEELDENKLVPIDFTGIPSHPLDHVAKQYAFGLTDNN